MPRNRLTDKEVLKAYKLMTVEKLRVSIVAKRFNSTNNTMNGIKNGTHYTHITGAIRDKKNSS